MRAPGLAALPAALWMPTAYAQARAQRVFWGGLGFSAPAAEIASRFPMVSGAINQLGGFAQLVRAVVEQLRSNYAAGLEDLTFFIRLLKEGADAHLQDSEGYTPLDLAASNSFWSTVALDPWDCFPLLCPVAGDDPILRRLQGTPEGVRISSGKSLL